VPGLGASFGRGGATTAQWDIANADCIVIMGSNMAECHPVAFRFVMQAKEKGATVIHIDPRFSRTSALSDMHVPLRAGTDIAFIGGLINHVLQNELWFKEYVVAYTNAATLIHDEFKDTEDLDGVFSGYEPERGAYDFSSWQYRGRKLPSDMARDPKLRTTEPFSARVAQPAPAERDDTLQDPRCVFQILKRHYARYTPEMVARICGVPQEQFLRVARAIADASGRERTTAWCYAVGWTQHTTGVQMIRACGILQLLLGNIGRPGGGILALRGHATIQGSTDIPTLYNLLPGYLPMPSAQKTHQTLADYIKTERAETGWWSHVPEYIVSLLKAWYGDAAKAGNEWNYRRLPKITGDHSQLPMTLAIRDGAIRGLFVMGQNPAVGGHNAGLVRKALAQLDWMVVRDMFETETASFWYASPEARRGEIDPTRIKTEVFLLPAAMTAEKDGSYTNTHRLVQYHHKAVEPPGDARSETWFVFHVLRRLRELYAGSTLERDRAIFELTLDYPTAGPHDEPVVDAIVSEINGFRVADRVAVDGFEQLKDDGSTACGCWIYSGIYPSDGVNRAASRVADPADGPGTHLGWGFAWPANRRILYNRASADPAGRPWSERKRYVWWDAAQKKWVGSDVPDFPETKRPAFKPRRNAKGMDAHPGTAPFIMKADGLAWLFAPSGVVDGPLPTHYEPVESPMGNALYAEHARSPVFKNWERKDNRYHRIGDERYPYVITTYRLTEHHTGGLMSRALPWLAELQPEAFVEVSPALATEKGIVNGGWVTVWTERGEVEAKALVTERMKPLRLNGTVVHQIGMPWHFGWQGYATGDSANVLSAIVGDPNTSIHEGKVFTCNIRAGRRQR
jgi:formate dehydrogenase major subunit